MNIYFVYLLVSVPKRTQINGVLLHSQQSEILPHESQVVSSGLHVDQGVRFDCGQLAQNHLPQSTAHTHPFLNRTRGSQIRSWIARSTTIWQKKFDTQTSLILMEIVIHIQELAKEKLIFDVDTSLGLIHFVICFFFFFKNKSLFKSYSDALYSREEVGCL